MRQKREYREKLIEQVRLMGQMVIDNAEEIVSRIPQVSDLKIMLYFPQGDIGAPSLTVTREHFPEPEKLMETIYLQEDKES